MSPRDIREYPDEILPTVTGPAKVAALPKREAPTNSSLMDRFGTPLKVRQQRLGHSDARLTLNVYTHIVGEDDVRIAAQLGEILHPIAPKSKEEGLDQFGQALVN